jgi:hypothetical protein
VKKIGLSGRAAFMMKWSTLPWPAMQDGTVAQHYSTLQTLAFQSTVMCAVLCCIVVLQ